MKIANPKVTLADDARIGVSEQVRQGFLDWLYQFSVKGDDGEEYSLGGSILSMAVEKMDLVTINVGKGRGSVRQLRGSIYKVASFPGYIMPERFFRNPQGTLKVLDLGDHIHVTCGPEYTVDCYPDGSWHIVTDTGDGIFSADLWHRPAGFPLWYGRETPSALTQHSITYGYNWAGAVEGSFRFKGKTVKVSGFGIRERYVAVDSSAAELGGWEDWGFVAFNEIHSSMYDMRLGMKDFSINDLVTGRSYGSDGTFKGGDRDTSVMEITHGDWAFLRELDGFIPTSYRMRFNVEDGCYEISARVANASVWGATFRTPDNPVATLVFEDVRGTFTDKSGTVRTLTGGRGCLSIRQWHQYPSILPRELYSDEAMPESESKFDTL